MSDNDKTENNNVSETENNNVSERDLVSLITLVISIAVRYGLPYVLEILDSINRGKITKEDIDNLVIDKKPEDYFNR